MISSFKEYLKQGQIKKKTPDPEEAKSLINKAFLRFEYFKEQDITEKGAPIILENVYESMREAIQALMSSKGFKPYSHEATLHFLIEFYANNFSEEEFRKLDRFRLLRNDSVYRAISIQREDAEACKRFAESILQKIQQFQDKNQENGQYRVLDKIVFKITQDAAKFLNALTTNELNKPLNAFLDKFGKLIVLADQLQQQDTIYIAIPNKYEQQFLQHLQPYMKLSKARIEKTNLLAAHIIPGKNDEKISNIIIPQNIGYLALLENLQQIKSFQEISEEEYTRIRLENNTPLQGIDFHNEMFLECNIPEAISYTKGCYLGQEIIARVHNKSKPVRILTRILYQQLPPDGKVTSQGQEIGKVTSSCYSEKHNSFLCFAMIKNQEEEIDKGKILQ